MATYGAGLYGAGLYGIGETAATTTPGTAVFLTPMVRDRPPYLPDSSQAQYNLWRHFENRLRGVIVWQRSDGTWVQDTPSNYEAAQTQPAAYFNDDPIGPDLVADYQTDTNVNYPWNPSPGSGAFARGQSPGSFVYTQSWDGTHSTDVLDPFLSLYYQPGAENVVDQEEVLELTAAGYGDCIS